MTSCGKTEYTYDAEGNRIKISEGESEIRYLYDTNQSLPKVIKRTQNGISTIYVYGKELISEKTDDDTSYYHFDYRGSTVALTDKNGKITDKYQYDVYGNSRHTEGESDTPFRYNGSAGVMTDANNLLYMKSRYYNPEILRFISADILTGDIRNTQSLNRYAYCEGNPVSFTDPFGLSREIKLQKQEQIEAAKREQVSEIVHGTLDIAGMTPVVGMAADGLNGVIYIFEGDLVGASFSAVAFIPVIGEVATPSKYGGKLVLATAESGANNVLGAAGKHVDDAAELILNSAKNIEKIDVDKIIEKSKVVSEIDNKIIGLERIGSGLKVDSLNNKIITININDESVIVQKEFPYAPISHGFNDIIDNYAGYAQEFDIPNAKLYQLEGSLNGVEGRFEWIIQDNYITHRRFVNNGKINGKVNRP